MFAKFGNKVKELWANPIVREEAKEIIGAIIIGTVITLAVSAVKTFAEGCVDSDEPAAEEGNVEESTEVVE